VAKLTEKQRRFVAEYLIDLNATAAAQRAGYKDPNIGRQLITKNNVSAAIQARQSELQSKLEITQERVITELAKIAFANGTMYARVVAGGSRVELEETDNLSEDQRAAISGIKEGKFGIEVSTYDKVKALELLGKHLGTFTASTGGTVTRTENNLLSAIMGAGEVDTDDLSEVE